MYHILRLFKGFFVKHDRNTLRAKVKRQLTCLLPVTEGRRGACRSCGACCRLPYECPALQVGKDGRSRCAIYAIRPTSCRVYPRTPREHVTHAVCGFAFKAPPASHSSAAKQRAADRR